MGRTSIAFTFTASGQALLGGSSDEPVESLTASDLAPSNAGPSARRDVATLM